MATGSMPGTGTNDSRRNRINAPSVNHSRFLSSVALAKFARLILEASCSAADAILFQIPLGSEAHIGRTFVIASVAKQSNCSRLDCFVASAPRNDGSGLGCVLGCLVGQTDLAGLALLRLGQRSGVL